MGMANTGYSESSQVRMYTAYQNRVATATDSFNRAVLNYDNAIKDAQMQNNAVLAEIALQTLQKQAELSIQFVQRRDELLAEKTNKLLEVDKMYHAQYLDVLDQINRENELAEEARQFNESKTLEKDIADAKLDEEKRQFDALHGTENVTELVESELPTEPKPTTPEIDMDSVAALGIGTPTEKALNRYIANGWVEMYQEGNSVKFKLTPAGTEHFKQNLRPDQESKSNVLRGFITENNLDTMIQNGFVETYFENGFVKYRITQKGKKKLDDWYAKNPGQKQTDSKKVNSKNVIAMLENIGDNW
jgi:DNA-binding PadR family transcriptional regulator